MASDDQPQVHANGWIKKMENGLDVTKLSSRGLSNILINAINYRKPVLIENIGKPSIQN